MSEISYVKFVKLVQPINKMLSFLYPSVLLELEEVAYANKE